WISEGARDGETLAVSHLARPVRARARTRRGRRRRPVQPVLPTRFQSRGPGGPAAAQALGFERTAPAPALAGHNLAAPERVARCERWRAFCNRRSEGAPGGCAYRAGRVPLVEAWPANSDS